MDVGVYYKNNTMSGWATFKDNCSNANAIPNTIIKELEINYANNKIRAGTYGRSLWESSNLVCPADYDLTLTGSVSASEWQEAEHDIYSDQSVVTGTVFNRAGNAVELNPGFIADATANSNLIYKAFIHPCNLPYNSPFPLPRMSEINNENNQGQKEFDKTLSMIIIPNPNSGIFNLYLENINQNCIFTIFNLLGVEIKSFEINDEQRIKVDLSAYPKGIYFVKLKNQETSSQIIKKIMVQ